MSEVPGETGRERRPARTRVGQDRVGRSDAGRDRKRLEERNALDEQEDEAGRDEPANGHDGEEEHGERPPLAADVRRRQVDAGKHDLDANDDAEDLERQVVPGFLVKVGPLPRRDPVESDRADGCRTAHRSQ